MRVVHDGSTELTEVLKQAQLSARSHLAIGVFDGVHCGHQQLITGLVKAAHSTGNVAVVLTFDPHPATTLGHEPLPLLTTVEERARLLAALGLDIMVVLPFTPATARIPATDFVEALVHHLRLAELWSGPDFALGHRREGDIPFLLRLGAERGFAVHVVDPLMWEGATVSSGRVRAALKAGDIPQATGCLGRPYRLTGVITPLQPPPPGEMEQEGHSIGAPTVNISPPPERLVPACGVYACLAQAGRLGTRPAVVNIGIRSTPGGCAPVVEARLLDFEGDLCNQALALDFIARLQDERAFPTHEALIAQVRDDATQARTIFVRRGA